MENLKVYRKKAGLTQQQLADKIGVLRTVITNWETSVSTPPTKYLLSLSEALGCTVDELLTDEK